MVDQCTSTDRGMPATKPSCAGLRCSILCRLVHDGQCAMGRLLNKPGRLFMRRQLRSNRSVRLDRSPRYRGDSPSPRLFPLRNDDRSDLPAGHCRRSKASRPAVRHGAPSLCLTADSATASEHHGPEECRPLGAETSTTTMAIVLRCSGSSVSSSCCRSLSGESGRVPTGGALSRCSGPNHRTR